MEEEEEHRGEGRRREEEEVPSFSCSILLESVSF